MTTHAWDAKNDKRRTQKVDKSLILEALLMAFCWEFKYINVTLHNDEVTLAIAVGSINIWWCVTQYCVVAARVWTFGAIFGYLLEDP